MSDPDNSQGTDPAEIDPTVIQPPSPLPAKHDATVSFSPALAAMPAGQESLAVESTTTPSVAGQRAPARELRERFGRYRIERPLGKGAMGAVYLALDSQLDRQVALKVPFFDAAGDSDLIDRFYREARSMATLHHPNLCPVYDVGAIDGVHYLTMAYVAGKSLAELLRKQPELSDRQMATLILKLALALDSAHQAGIVHRDLKPANIMIRPDGEPVIMDFGLARRQKEGEAELTHSGMLLGTPAYMSPEQVEGRTDRVTATTDVYALGVILYQLLAGKLPFEGSVGSVLAGIVHQQPRPPREVRAARVNAELEAICLKAMSKSIDQRYRSARELADELKRFLRSGTQPPVPPTVTPPAGPAGSKPARRESAGAAGDSPRQKSTKPARRSSSAAAVPPARRARQRPPGASRATGRSPQNLLLDRRIWLGGAAGLAAVIGALFSITRNNTPARNVVADRGPPPSAPAAQPTTAAAVSVPQPVDIFTPRSDAPDQSWRLPPEPRRFPSLHDTISHPPPWLIADADPPFDLVRYFEVPVWEDNAAPAYLKAMFEFTGEVYRCFPESSREQQRQVATDRQQRFLQLDEQWRVNRPSVSDAQFEAILPEFETGFTLLRLAQRKRECVFEIGAGLGVLLPHLQSCRYVARIEAHRARRDLRENRIDDVIDDAALVLRLAHDSNRRGCAITNITAFAADATICDDVVRPLLLHPQLTKERCARLIAILHDHERQKDDILRQGLQGEYIILRVSLHDFQYHVGGFSRDLFRNYSPDPEAYRPPASPGEALAVVLSMMASMNTSTGNTLGDAIDKNRVAQRIDAMTDADYAREVTFADSGFKSFLAICDRPVWERVRLFSKIQDQFARNQESRIVRYLSLPDTLMQIDRRNRVQLAGLIGLACLRFWQFDHPEPPTSLESLLAAAGVDNLVPDPYGAGQPLRLTTVDGRPVIYSLGIDEHDDGGQKEWNLKPDGAGDMTFRLETSEALQQRRTVP